MDVVKTVELNISVVCLEAFSTGLRGSIHFVASKPVNPCLTERARAGMLHLANSIIWKSSLTKMDTGTTLRLKLFLPRPRRHRRRR